MHARSWRLSTRKTPTLENERIVTSTENARVVENQMKLKGVEAMEKERKDLNVPDPSETCGDGNCGCGCGLPMDTSMVSSEEKIQEGRSLAGKEALEVAEDPVDTRPVEK